MTPLSDDQLELQAVAALLAEALDVDEDTIVTVHELAHFAAERIADLEHRLAEAKARAPSSRSVCLGETGDYDIECTACGRSLDEGEHSAEQCVRYAKESAAAEALMCHEFELEQQLVAAKKLIDDTFDTIDRVDLRRWIEQDVGELVEVPQHLRERRASLDGVKLVCAPEHEAAVERTAGKFYAHRDLPALDRAGGYYMRHVSAMTTERLHSKSDIAAELGWRDQCLAAAKELCDDLLTYALVEWGWKYGARWDSEYEAAFGQPRIRVQRRLNE